MAAISLRLRAELRERWRGLVAITLLAGAAGGVTLAAIAGARRTDTAYARLERATNAYDVTVNPDLGTDSKLRERDVAKLPQVAQIGRVNGLLVATTRFQHPGRDLRWAETTIALASDGRAFSALARPKIVDGRLPDRHHADEVLIDEVLARRQHLGVGDRIRALGVAFRDADDLFSSPGGELAEKVRAGELGTKIELKVVGVGTVPDQIVVDQGFTTATVALSPAFLAKHPEIGVPFFGLLVRLRNGAHDIPAFRRGVEHLVPREAIAFQTAPANEAKFDRAVQPYVGALTIFAIVVAVTALLLVGQALARQSFLAAGDTPTLSALGFSRSQLFTTGMLRAALVALGGGALALVVAFAASPLMPIGPARTAEPAGGLAFDGFALGVGALVVVVATLLLAAGPAWRAARARATSNEGPRPSWIASRLAASGASAPAAVGVRMALEPGRGRTAVPVRTTILASALAIIVVVGALGVVASIDHLVDTPRLFGWNWDVQVNAYKANPAANRRVHREIGQMLDRSPAVHGWSTVMLSDVRLVKGGSIPTLGIDPSSRDVVPTLVSGRLPRRRGEIALGLRTLRSASADIGSTVLARDNDGASNRLQVVGRVVLPGIGTYPGSDKTALGEGAVVTAAALRTLGPNFNRDDLVIDFADGASRAQRRRVLDRVEQLTDARGDADTFEIGELRRPSDILSYEKVRTTPVALAGVLAALALASVVHALVSAIRRRRRDLAILETLGFTRRQVSATVAWQATTVGVMALVVGLPLGIVLGRVSWQVLADELGTVAEPVVPALAVVVAIPIVLALVNVAALVPGRLAGRVRPAAVLRSE